MHGLGAAGGRKVEVGRKCVHCPDGVGGGILSLEILDGAAPRLDGETCHRGEGMPVAESVCVIQVVFVHHVEGHGAAVLTVVVKILVAEGRRAHICVSDKAEIGIQVRCPLEVLVERDIGELEDRGPVVLVEIGLQIGGKRTYPPQGSDEGTVRIIETQRRFAGEDTVEVSGLVHTVLLGITHVDLGAEREDIAGLVVGVQAG